MNASVSRSPPGRWRLFAPAMLTWGLTSVAITQPGMAHALSLTSALAGGSLLMWWLVERVKQTSKPEARVMKGRAPTAFVALLIVSCAAVLLVSTRVSLIEHVRADTQLNEAAEGRSTLEIEAQLTGYPARNLHQDQGRAWVRADLISARGSVAALLWLEDVDHISEQWAPGTRVAISGKLTAQAPADSAAYTVQVHELREIADVSFLSIAGRVASKLRHELVRLASAIEGAQLVPGFAVGDTSLVSPHLESAMLESSLTHLVAVSGSNTSLVIAGVVWVSAWFGAGIRLRLVLAAVSLIAFIIIVGPDSSVQRAAVMAAVTLASNFGGKKGVALPALGLAVLVLLVMNPWQALQPGFALSVAATAGILLCATPISGWLRKRLRFAMPLALTFAVAIASQFACGPLLLLLQPGIPVVGIVANVVAAPAAPIGTALGLIAALLTTFSASLALALVAAASIPASWVSATAFVSAQVPLGRWSWPEGWAGAVLLAACQFALLLAWWLHKGKLGLPGVGRTKTRRPWQKKQLAPPITRFIISLISCASIATIVAVTLVEPISQRLATPHGWSVVACDVGQGDAILLRNPAHPQEIVLVDTGDDPELLNACLTRFGVGSISLLVLSHDDRDHVGALDAIIHRVEAALISPTPVSESYESREVVHTLQRAGVPHAVAYEGLVRSSNNGVQLRTLAPKQYLAPIDSNAASLVMIATVGPTSVLLLGDTGEPEQLSLMRRGEALKAQVLKVAHHGSGDQAHALHSLVRAEWALVSVGADNRYGHPSNDTLSALARAETRVLRTDRHGSIALVPGSDGSLKPWVERVPQLTQAKA